MSAFDSCDEVVSVLSNWNARTSCCSISVAISDRKALWVLELSIYFFYFVNVVMQYHLSSVAEFIRSVSSDKILRFVDSSISFIYSREETYEGSA